MASSTAHVTRTVGYTLTYTVRDQDTARTITTRLQDALQRLSITRTGTVGAEQEDGTHTCGISWRAPSDQSAQDTALALTTAALGPATLDASRARVHTGYGIHTRVILDVTP